MTFSHTHVLSPHTQHACPIVAVRPRSHYARWRRTALPCAVAFLTTPKSPKSPSAPSPPLLLLLQPIPPSGLQMLHGRNMPALPVASSVPPASHVGGPGVEASDTGAQGRVHGCALRFVWGRAGSGGAHSLPLRLSPPPAPLVYASRQMSKRHLTAASSRSRPSRAFLSPSHLAQHSYPQTSPCPWSCLAALVSRPSVSRRFHTFCLGGWP